VSGEVIGRPDVVPYIAKWSGEKTGLGKIVQRKKREGIAYEKERSFDRDEHGVLWTRAPSEPGKGRAEFGKVHSLRQRVAMGALLCQVCGNRADRNEDGVLWLIDAPACPSGPRTRRCASRARRCRCGRVRTCGRSVWCCGCGSSRCTG
jgi:hypothetical protein